MSATPLGTDTFKWPDVHSPWTFEADWQLIDGRVECVALTIVSKPPSPVTSHLLREVHRHINGPLREKRQRSVTRIARHAPADIAKRARNQIDAYEDREGKTGPPRKPMAHFEEVARLYVEARTKGESASKYIALHMDNARPSTVRNWIQRCREVGLIGVDEEGE